MQRFHIKMAENIYTFVIYFVELSSYITVNIPNRCFKHRILFEVTVRFIACGYNLRERSRQT